MVLLIDNYDSFTHNLARYIEELGHGVTVVKNDQYDISQLEQFSATHLVLSPGPCTPNESGICIPAIRHFAGKIPILGVCLGHQAIAQSFGARIMRARHILHGKISRINVLHNKALFHNMPSSFNVTRYHSLLVDAATLSPEFRISAICQQKEEQEVMAIEHKSLPIFGVQFHPESLLTEHGHDLLRNFLR